MLVLKKLLRAAFLFEKRNFIGAKPVCPYSIAIFLKFNQLTLEVKVYE